MRTFGTFSATLGISLLVSAGWMAGCQDRAGDCELNLLCPDPTSTSTGGGGGGGGGGAGGDGGGGMDPGNCDPAMGVVDDGCGVFASSSLGVQGALGGKTTPVRSLQEAVDLASEKKRVYACAEVFDEAVTVAEGITIYGGLDCANDWALLAETKSEIAAPDDVIALTIGPSATGFGLNDFVVRAADATVPGGSSIGVLVDTASVRLTRCDVFAGKGADGVMGDTPTDSVGPTDPADATIKGNNGKAACLVTDSQTGGASKTNVLCATSIGGGGGAADTAAGFSGSAIPASTGTALGGVGQPSADMGSWNCTADGVNGGGTAGTNGAAGTPGDGAQGAGQLSSTGYVGESGTSGGTGTPGQGGGGGGGAKGKVNCAGASGGSGGAGGCPGAGGFGGAAGGASIGLALLNATVTFELVNVTTGQGGKGGDGGFGQSGGVGGLGGVGGAGDNNAPGTLSACDGGKGGQGGFGGKGGGGRGGHSVGIAHTGTAPSMEGIAFALGAGGTGGLGTDAAHDGAPGVNDEVLAF